VQKFAGHYSRRGLSVWLSSRYQNTGTGHNAFPAARSKVKTSHKAVLIHCCLMPFRSIDFVIMNFWWLCFCKLCEQPLVTDWLQYDTDTHASAVYHNCDTWYLMLFLYRAAYITICFSLICSNSACSAYAVLLFFTI